MKLEFLLVVLSVAILGLSIAKIGLTEADDVFSKALVFKMRVFKMYMVTRRIGGVVLINEDKMIARDSRGNLLLSYSTGDVYVEAKDILGIKYYKGLMRSAGSVDEYKSGWVVTFEPVIGRMRIHIRNQR